MDIFRIVEDGELNARGDLDGEVEAAGGPPTSGFLKGGDSACPECARNGAPHDHDADGFPRDLGTVGEPLGNLGPEPLDALRYIASNSDLIAAFGIDAAAGRQHYVEFGQAEGRRVDSFSAFRYAASHSDLISAFGADARALTLHYIENGFREGRSTSVFDPLSYGAANPDLLQSFGRDQDALSRHYVEFGFRERRSTDFDGLSYAAANPDLARVFGSNEDALLTHFLDFGFAEGRRTSGFDALRYASSNPDLARAFGADVAGITSHYVNFGIREGRSIDSFDALIYAASNVDLARALGTDANGLTLHYLRFGVNEARPTNAFDRVAYILSNPDLASAGVGIGGAVNHWISFGVGEGRTSSGQFGLEQTGHALNASGQVSGSHATVGDRDWYQASLNAGQLVTVRLTPDGSQDAFLRVYDGSGRLLFSASNTGVGASETITFTAPSAGVFYLVTGSAGDAGSGTYTLGLSTNAVPVITSAASASIAENTAASTIVYQATATDADGETLVFGIEGTNAASFTIDAATGAVRLRAPADFETQQSYRFSVTATDPNGQRTVRDVTLSITDVADTPAPPPPPPPPPPPTGTPGPVPVIADREANDTAGTAQFIDRATLRVDANNANLPSNTLPSGSIQGTIGTPTDRDFFSIYLNEGEQLILDIDGSTGGLDAFVRFYSPGGAQIGFNDDSATLDPGSSTQLDSFGRWRAPTSGTYTFVVESYAPPAGSTETRSQGAYTLNFSIGPAASAAQIQEEDIQALLTGRFWAPGAILTYSFPDASTDYPDYATDRGEQEQSNGFAQLNVGQQNSANDVIQGVLAFSNVDIRFSFGSDADATLRFGRTNTGGTAHAYLPPIGGDGGSGRSGDLWFRNGTFDNPVVGNYSWITFAHEVGHALGLGHGHERLSYAHDSMEYSIMTYRAYIGGPITGYTNETFGFAQSFMMYDIAALQRLYGADFNYNAGNNVYRWNASTGQMTIDGAAAVTPGANRVFLTVWDGGGNDTYDLSNYTNGTIIDLRPGEFSTTSQVQLANLGNGNYARGNVANALLFNGDTRSLIENAVAGVGNDTLIANQVANRFTGGGGADTFRWVSAGDSATGAADTILDFQSGVDRIDLSGIDADSRTAANDAFRYIGSGAFTGSAGELRYETGPGGTRLLGDVNGDGVADFEVVLQNTPPPAASDFFF